MQTFHDILLLDNVMGMLERQWSRNRSYVIKQRVREFTYLGAGGGCEAAVTARTRC